MVTVRPSPFVMKGDNPLIARSTLARDQNLGRVRAARPAFLDKLYPRFAMYSQRRIVRSMGFREFYSISRKSSLTFMRRGVSFCLNAVSASASMVGRLAFVP